MDQGSEIIVPHRLMIFYSLDKGKEREKQKGILLHHALIIGELSTLPLDLASITNLCSILRFHPVNVCSFGGVPVKSVQHHLQEKTFAGKKLKEEDRKSVNNWFISWYSSRLFSESHKNRSLMEKK